MAIDPICGTQVDEETTEFQTTYGGKDFYFCSEECETKFDENPAQYAAGDPDLANLQNNPQFVSLIKKFSSTKP